MQTAAIDRKWACKGIKNPLETLCGHLPEVHFHTPIQKVKGYVGGFTSYVGITTNQKILFCPQAVKGKIATPQYEPNTLNVSSEYIPSPTEIQVGS